MALSFACAVLTGPVFAPQTCMVAQVHLGIHQESGTWKGPDTKGARLHALFSRHGRVTPACRVLPRMRRHGGSYQDASQGEYCIVAKEAL